MEAAWTVQTEDGATIYGVRNSRAPDSSKAIFIVHGLGGHMYEYAIKRAADFFEDQYDVYRFNLYDGRPGARSILDCTLSTHAADLNAVLAEFSKHYKQSFLVGHSYGGPTIMLANPGNVAAVSLWDPTYDLRRVQREFQANYVETPDYFILNWGTSQLISKAMYAQANTLDADACASLAQAFKSPVQVIHAEDGFYVSDKYSYHSHGNPKNIRETVAGTVHCFYEGESCEILLKKTRAWFDQD